MVAPCGRASHRLAWLVVFIVPVLPAVSTAQRLAARDASASASRAAANVRAELAAVLLQSKKYDEAARELRALIATDSNNADYRLDLARAFAWGERWRDAERELLVLRARNMRVASVDSMLRAIREAMEPRSAEAAAWVAERREYAPYRLAYARALVRDRSYARAVVQYDTLIAGTSIGPIPPPIVLRREQAFAYLDAGDADLAVTRLRDVLRLTPADTNVRHILAVTLNDQRRHLEARAHYDTLLSAAPTARLFTERGELRLVMRDTSGAQSDLRASIELDATTAALLLLGDIHRERGEFGPATTMYRAALKRGDANVSRARVRGAIAQMARDERPLVAFAPTLGDDPGWHVNTAGVGDNLGVHYAASMVRRTFGLGEQTRVGMAMLHQYLGERSDARKIDFSVVGAEASASSGFAYGPFLGRAAISGGALRLSPAQTVPIGSAAIGAWVDAWQLGLEAIAAPAYSSLLTTTAMRALNADVRNAITEQGASATLGGPIRSLDVAISGQTSRLDDGNHRTTLQGYARYPLVAGVSVVYTASRMTFAKRSVRYWDPFEYTAHAAGLEVATRSHYGLTAALRALPGKSWSVEPPPPQLRTQRGSRSPQRIHRSAVQVATSGELAWREPRWEGTAAVTYGQGRAGEYRRLGITMGMRVLP